MDGTRFDRLTRVLVAGGSRRTLLHVVGALPVVGGLASMLAAADAQQGKGKNDNDNDDNNVAADKNKNKNKRRKKQCKKKKAKACDGRCGTVTVKCKKGNGKSKRTQIDCGSCECEPACPVCQTCQEDPTTLGVCIPDPAQVGEECGPNQVCQADGVCACDVCETGCPFSSVQAAIDAADDGDTIRICAGTYQEGEELLIATSLTLIGAGDGEDGTILDGQGLGRVVRVVADTTVDLQGLRITGGNTGGEAEPGGGIANFGDLTLTGCTVIDNAATGFGGGLSNDSGEMTLTDCTVSGNEAAFSGGGINNDGGILTLTDSTVSGNFTEASGGGIDNDGGTVTLTDSTVRDNTANDRGGGIFNFDGTLTLTDSTVRGNEVNTDGGGIYNASGTVSLEGDTHVCENTDENLPSNCAGFTPPAAACTETCPA